MTETDHIDVGLNAFRALIDSERADALYTFAAYDRADGPVSVSRAMRACDALGEGKVLPKATYHSSGCNGRTVCAYEKMDDSAADVLLRAVAQKIGCRARPVSSIEDLSLEEQANLLLLCALKEQVPEYNLPYADIEVGNRHGDMKDESTDKLIGKSFIEVRLRRDELAERILGCGNLVAEVKVVSYSLRQCEEKLRRFYVRDGRFRPCQDLDDAPHYELIHSLGYPIMRGVKGTDPSLFVKRQFRNRTAAIPWLELRNVPVTARTPAKREGARRIVRENIVAWEQCRMGRLYTLLKRGSEHYGSCIRFEQTMGSAAKTVRLPQDARSKRVERLKKRCEGVRVSVTDLSDMPIAGQDSSDSQKKAIERLAKAKARIEELRENIAALVELAAPDEADWHIEVVNDKRFDKAGSYKPSADDRFVQHIMLSSLAGRKKSDLAVLAESLLNQLAIKRDIVDGRTCEEPWPDGLEATFSIRRILGPNDGPLADGWVSATVRGDGSIDFGVATPPETDRIHDENESIETVIAVNGSLLSIEPTPLRITPSLKLLDSMVRNGDAALTSRGNKAVEGHMRGSYDITLLYESPEACAYSVGSRRAPSSATQAKSIAVRLVRAHRGSAEAFRELLPTLTATSIRLGSATVLPWPVKYIREWAQMQGLIDDDICEIIEEND